MKDAEDNLTYRYDLLGRRKQAKYTNDSQTVDYIWDNAGRLESTTTTTADGKTIAYDYDNAGNRKQVIWPGAGFHVTKTYDALNRPTFIHLLGTTQLAEYVYDDLSRCTTLNPGNGTQTIYDYNTQSAMDTLLHDLANMQQDISYGYIHNAVREIKQKSWDNDLYAYQPKCGVHRQRPQPVRHRSRHQRVIRPEWQPDR